MLVNIGVLGSVLMLSATCEWRQHEMAVTAVTHSTNRNHLFLLWGHTIYGHQCFKKTEIPKPTSHIFYDSCRPNKSIVNDSLVSSSIGVAFLTAPLYINQCILRPLKTRILRQGPRVLRKAFLQLWASDEGSLRILLRILLPLCLLSLPAVHI